MRRYSHHSPEVILSRPDQQPYYFIPAVCGSVSAFTCPNGDVPVNARHDRELGEFPERLCVVHQGPLANFGSGGAGCVGGL
jgi:hypothetical protein